MSQSEPYENICEAIDIQSYIDYMCIRTYIDDMDFTEEKNTVVWRSRDVTSNEYEDGRWRWALYDLDGMEFDDASKWGCSTKAEKNSFVLVPRYTGGVTINQQAIFAALKTNDMFKKQYVNTFMDLTNTMFRYENVMNDFKEYGPISDTFQGGNVSTKKMSFYDDFFKNRPAYIIKYMADEFELEGTLENLTVSLNNPEGGLIKVNTVYPEYTDDVWIGQYYTDFPVMLTAEPFEGYCFKGWMGDIQSKDACVDVFLEDGGVNVYAVFEKEKTD